jgi:superfamily II DNA/RNA helicase
MMRSKVFDAKRVELLVLDEADRLLSMGRGLHSSTFRLNVSALCGIGGT